MQKGHKGRTWKSLTKGGEASTELRWWENAGVEEGGWFKEASGT